MRSVLSLIPAPIVFVLLTGLVLFGLIAIGVVLDFIDSLSHILWPLLGALPLIVILAVMIPELLRALRALRELTPKDSGINVATSEEVYRARMAEAKLVFLSEVAKKSPPRKVRKRTKRTPTSTPRN